MHNDHPLYFSRSEKRGIFILLLICVLMHFIPNVYSSFIKAPPFGEDSVAFMAFVESVRQKEVVPVSNVQQQQPVELFRFNPNSLDEAGWKRLGIHENTAKRIRKYVDKGGRFYQKEDLYKIYGMPTEQVAMLLPYIDIPERNRKPQTLQNPYPLKVKSISQQPVDINLADSATFESLPGIGPVLAKRIVLFREKLGGFEHVDQVGETYGLADSTFKKIQSWLTRGDQPVKKININTITEDMLRSHPYVGYKKAAAIIRYRNEHGAFIMLSDFEKLVVITPTDIQKLKPYLVFE